MKTFITRIFCLIMVFPLLFGSTGFTVHEHFCKIKGTKTFSFSASKTSCCSVRKSSSEQSKKLILKRAKCCSDQISIYKISPNASQGAKIDFKNPLLELVNLPIFSYRYAHTDEQFSFITLVYSNSSPPLSGRERLVFIQSFLI
jgi:hypothetical protein